MLISRHHGCTDSHAVLCFVAVWDMTRQFLLVSYRVAIVTPGLALLDGGGGETDGGCH